MVPEASMRHRGDLILAGLVFHQNQANEDGAADSDGRNPGQC